MSAPRRHEGAPAQATPLGADGTRIDIPGAGCAPGSAQIDAAASGWAAGVLAAGDAISITLDAATLDITPRRGGLLVRITTRDPHRRAARLGHVAQAGMSAFLAALEGAALSALEALDAPAPAQRPRRMRTDFRRGRSRLYITRTDAGVAIAVRFDANDLTVLVDPVAIAAALEAGAGEYDGPTGGFSLRPAGEEWELGLRRGDLDFRWSLTAGDMRRARLCVAAPAREAPDVERQAQAIRAVRLLNKQVRFTLPARGRHDAFSRLLSRRAARTLALGLAPNGSQQVAVGSNLLCSEADAMGRGKISIWGAGVTIRSDSLTISETADLGLVLAGSAKIARFEGGALSLTPATP